MKARGSTLWTIQQLGDEVARALALGYAGSSNGRVRDVPDLRTIRYYTTLGLLDRPAEMRGRTALYGQRHLLQLVAIKHLQARGLSLSQIQQEITGATDKMLRRLAGEMANPDRERTDKPPGPERPGRSKTFWKSSPAPISRQGAAERSELDDAYQTMRPLQAIDLVDSVMLLLAPLRAVDPAELPEIRRAATSLIQCLREHQLIQTTPKGEGDAQADSPVD